MSVGYRTMSMAEMSTILRNLQRTLESLQTQISTISGGEAGVGSATSHDLLSTTHSDTESAPVAQGDLIVGGATPTWERLALGASGTFLKSDGSNPNWATLQASDIDTLALLLDQTTPQTVINGIPLLDKEYDDFSNPDEFVNKGYVDWVATAIGANYYMTDDTDGDTGYKVCSLTPSAGSETYIEESGVTDGQLLGTWISDVGEAPAKLPRGMYDWFIFAEKTSGTKTLRLYWELYERKTDTSEVLIATSSESNELKMGEKTSYVVPLALDSDYTPDSGSRIVGKIYASVSGGGNAPTVKIYYQGASGSRWEIPSTTEILNNIYIKRDEIGIDDDDILQVDQATGLTAGNLVRATSSGLESRTDAEVLAQLSGKASSAFDWNDQNLDNVPNLSNKTTASWSKTIGSGGDYATWADMIADMPDLIAHQVTVTIKKGTILTETCELLNKHGLTSDAEIIIQAENYFPKSGVIPTATGATATTLQDTNQSWATNEFQNCWVLIVDGTGTDNGFVQITGNDATSLTVASWPGTQPDNTSRYLIVGALIDGEGIRDCFEIQNNTVFILGKGIGVNDGNKYGFLTRSCFLIELYYCGAYNCYWSGIHSGRNLYVYLEYNGVVNCNAANNYWFGGITFSGGILGEIKSCGISGNNREGILVSWGASCYIPDNFGHNNGAWGTYAKWSGQAQVAGTECSGSSGNHSDEGKAGTASQDQAATYTW